MPALTDENRPAHAYTYPFEPNPEWSNFYAGAAEILQYFQNFAKKYELNKYIKLIQRGRVERGRGQM